ncbi:hypothetical protein ACQEV4_21015 [Streptomyces shenzhenensis]|uniref:MmyB family transcriptional regulator n=1 Tax=Streptomyces shenzhenensis TaxID=943815 RepID=UPI003D91325A
MRNRAVSDLAIVSDLRRATGRFPRDARLAELIRELTAGNRTFARLWVSGTVAALALAAHTGRTYAPAS